ncbi:MAG: V-type ATP synthase subunit F [Gammaproteobacteria bacterium]
MSDGTHDNTPGVAGEHPPTRLIFMGEEALADGFALVGFETHPDPTPRQLDELLAGLIRNRERAFLVLDTAVGASDSTLLDQVCSEGGRIVVSQVPSLRTPDQFESDLDRQIRLLTGETA